MYNNHDDFDTQIQPEELQDDNPIDEDWHNEEPDWDYMNGEYPEHDEGSDRDNWEDNQVFLDQEF